MADLHGHLDRLSLTSDGINGGAGAGQQQSYHSLSPPGQQVRKDQQQQQDNSEPYLYPQHYASSSGFSNPGAGGGGYAQGTSTGGYGPSQAGSYARSKEQPMMMGQGQQGVRVGLPTEWMGRAGGAAGGGGGYDGYDRQHQSGYAALVGRPGPDDEVIPTAIVIKNIPFQVPKETLLGIMEDLHLPPPFAFNYHYDNGQFRGLAFANFRAANDAALTVSALNGFDLQGRKLRTEFKKVLKEGEKERIERDKALKRMRSQQQLTVDAAGPPVGSWNRREASAPGGYGGGGGGADVEDDYGRPVQGQFSTAFAGRAGSGSDLGSVSRDLDLNDPQALEIYSRVLIFKDDSLRDELAFARSLSTHQRRTVHLVAQKLGLEHRSVGEMDDRHVVVFKAGAGPAAKPLRHSHSTHALHPSSSSPYHQHSPSPSPSTTSSSYLSPPSPSPLPPHQPTHSLAHSSKKSLPDLRAASSSSRRGATNYASMGRVPSSSRTSVQGLFSGFGGGGEVPPVPMREREEGVAVRMPRGPDEDKGFGTQ
ncbi:hypothetical protein RQP46_011183 [Phenoliferia psychrophenolica]